MTPPRLITALALAVWLIGYNGHAQTVCYDATIGAQLADVPGVTRAFVATQAYPWEVEKRYMPALEAAGKQWKKKPLLQYDWEPWGIKPGNPAFDPHIGSLDPHDETVTKIQSRHQFYAEALAQVIPLAKERGIRVGVWEFLSLRHSRLNDVSSDGIRYQTWRAEQDLVLRLPIKIDGKTTTLLAMLNETGGHVWVGWFLPRERNDIARPKLLEASIVAWERIGYAIEDAGGKVMPTIGVEAKGEGTMPLAVEPDYLRTMIRRAQAKHGAVAIWAAKNQDGSDQVTPEFKALLREELE